MTDFLVNPDPKVLITDADITEISLLSFHMVVIVEPDPETWMALPGDNMGEVIDLFNMGLRAELDPENDIYLNDENIVHRPDEIQHPNLLWIQYPGDDNFFDEAAFLSNAIFRFLDYDDFQHLEFYLRGVKQSHPNWNVAVVGGMFEDDVIRVANFIAEIGFPTTVVARQCVSRNAFVNLDELAIYKAWLDKYRIAGNDFSDDSDELFKD
jgi:hypothetical protein